MSTKTKPALYRFEFRQEEREDKPRLLEVWDDEPLKQVAHCTRVVLNKHPWVTRLLVTVVPR